VRVEGHVDDISVTQSGRQRVSVSTTAFAVGPTRQIHPSNVGVIVFLPEGNVVQLGQRIVAAGYLLPLDGPLNPGAFDEFQFLRSRGIDYKIFAEGVTGYEISLTPAMHVRNFGVRLADVFDSTLPPRFAGIMQAMIIGDRSGLDNDVRDAYRDIGMFHILVVSGLHLAILAAFVERTLNFFKVGQKNRSILTILFVILFTIFTGAGVATVRAAIMSIIFISSGIFGYENDTPTSMSLAAIILLVYQPLYLFDVGFIYSFSVVSVLVFVTTPMQNTLDAAALRFERLRPFFNNWYVKKYLAGTLAANLAYIPINAFFFYDFSPLSFVVNFLLMPSVFFVIILGFLMSIVGVFGGAGLFLANFFAFPIWFLLSIYEFVINLALHLPFATIITGRPGMLTMIICAVGIILFARFARYKPAKDKPFSRKLAYLSFALIISFSAQFAFNSTRPYINTTFLYVGQGDSAVISRGRSAIIIDGGGTFGRDIGENTGVFTLMPYLNYRGITRATAILTHNDRDHAIGLMEAINAGRIERIIMASANISPGDSIFDAVIYAANTASTPITYVKGGDIIQFYDAQLHILYPYEDPMFVGSNDNSLAIRFVHDGHSILFTGDIEAAAEAYLAETHGNMLTSGILSAAHHGSRSSTTQVFLDAVSPQAVVISAGRNNMYGHPHTIVTDRIDASGAEYFTTSEQGAVVIRTGGGEMRLRTMLP